MRIRYSRWDGTQNIGDLDADDLLEAMSDDLVADGDIRRALQRLFQRGAQMPQGKMPGLQDLLKQLRQRRQQQLERYDLGSTLDDIKKKVDEILKTERAGIEARRNDARERAERGEIPEDARRQLAEMAAQREAQLDQMPPDPAGRIKELQNYEFMDPEAWRMFQELLQSLRQQMLKPFMQGMQQALSNMSPQDMQRMREMIQDLNRMLRDRAEGNEPDFQAFKDKWGQNFPGVESLDQLMEQMGKQMAQMQSLMESMTPGQRRELQEMMQSLLAKDERLDAALAQLAMNLDQLMPLDEMRRRYDFKGDDPLTLREAMQLMDELAADGEARAPAPEGAGSGEPREDRPRRGREAPRRAGRAGPEAPRRDVEEARGGGLPRAHRRPARADRAGHPEDRRQGAARRLRASEARPLRSPRRSTIAAGAATAPTTPSATSSAIPSCST